MLVHVLRTFTVHVMWGLKDTLVMLATATSYTIGTNQVYINVLTVMAIQIGIKKACLGMWENKGSCMLQIGFY